MAPESARFEIAASMQTLVFSAPLYLAATVEDTPYQWLQLCEAGGTCKTVADLRGSGALTMPRDPTLGLSPDKRFVLCLQFVAANAATKSYRQHYYIVYDLVQHAQASFRSADGRAASTDNIIGWSAQHPHALELSAGHRKRVLALPAD